MESTIILFWASRLTVGMKGLTEFVATGLTVIALVLMSLPLIVPTSPEVTIAPVATLPVMLLALTLAALRLPTVLLITLTATPRKSPEFTSSAWRC